MNETKDLLSALYAAVADRYGIADAVNLRHANIKADNDNRDWETAYRNKYGDSRRGRP